MRLRLWIPPLLLAACTGDPEPQHQVPSLHTDPPVAVPYSEAMLHISGDPTPFDVEFGFASGDMLVVVVGQEGETADRVLDFGAPGTSRLAGYGRFEGFTEVYRRAPAVDRAGVHGFRIAAYRVDPVGSHTNAWFSYWASDLLYVYQTEFA